MIGDVPFATADVGPLDAPLLPDIADRIQGKLAPRRRRGGRGRHQRRRASRGGVGRARRRERDPRRVLSPVRRRRGRAGDARARGRRGSREDRASVRGRKGGARAHRRGRVRVLALDYGSARCGVAVCDPTETIVTPLEAVPGAGTRAGIGALAALVAQREVDLRARGPAAVPERHGDRPDRRDAGICPAPGGAPGRAGSGASHDERLTTRLAQRDPSRIGRARTPGPPLTCWRIGSRGATAASPRPDVRPAGRLRAGEQRPSVPPARLSEPTPTLRRPARRATRQCATAGAARRHAPSRYRRGARSPCSGSHRGMLAAWFLIELFQPFTGPGTGVVTVNIRDGASAGQIGDELAARRGCLLRFFFDLRARLDGDRPKFQPALHDASRHELRGRAVDPDRGRRARPVLPARSASDPGGLHARQIAVLAAPRGLTGSYLVASRPGHAGLDPRSYGAPASSGHARGLPVPGDLLQLRPRERRAPRRPADPAFHQNFDSLDFATRAARRA